ncbi:AAA family ATPase [Candidatus Leptofilum sp.]|uniref:AAA family ATPase n=1 Tax=Candidatus Leptofilum sp. TaxID=3241576 RepID=UPI003B5AD7BA
MSDTLRERYTDAPTLTGNLLIGSVRLLFWLFFHPSAWRNHLKRMDSTLSPYFSLADLQQRQWTNTAVLRFLLMTFFAWPLLVGLLLGLVLWLLNLPTTALLLGVMLGIAVGLIVGLAASIAGSVAIGVTVGMATGFALGLGGALLLRSAGDLILNGAPISLEIAVSSLIGATSGLAGGLAYGVGVGVTRDEMTQDTPTLSGAEAAVPSVSILRQVSGMMVGILIGLAAGFLARLLEGNWATALLTALPFGLAVGWRSQSWRRGAVAGILVGTAVWLAGGVPTASAVGGLVQALAFIAFVAALFALPYVLAEKSAGTWAGGLAGALGSGAGLFLFATDGAAYGPFLSFGLAGILLGLTLAWWRPVLLYPFLLIWNRILYQLDLRRADQPEKRPLLRWHSAFWDEFQRLPLINLDAHLLLTIQTSLAEGRTAMAYLSNTRQRWAAQSAQIELDAQQLERCETAAQIAEVHPGLAAGDLVGPASALLRSFSRISTDVAAALQQESAYNQRLALHAVEDRLDGLLRELTRSNEPYAARFRPIAAKWRQIVGEKGALLAEEAELRQEIDSPYIIGVPLTEKQAIFIGRQDVSSRIEQLLLDRRQPPLLLYGQRRVGKTSLLNNLGRLLPSTIVPLFVDLQGPASRAQDEAGFLYNVARSMVRSAKRQRGIVLPPLSREQLYDDPFTRFDEWLDAVELALAGNLALLMLDEFEALERVLALNRFDEEIVLGMLRHLIQHRPKFKVLLSGSHTLSEFSRWSSYLINVQVIHIGFLHPDEARQLVEVPVQGFALRYEPAASQRVLDLTEGHPFLVQLLCAEIVALKNEQPPAQRRLATVNDVETAVPEALIHGSFFFADMRNQTDEVGGQVLNLLAKAGDSEVVSRSELKRIMGVETAVLSQTLTQLQQRELIEPHGNGLRFQIELVRRWFQGAVGE